jgi:hypothetical protein
MMAAFGAVMSEVPTEKSKWRYALFALVGCALGTANSGGTWSTWTSRAGASTCSARATSSASWVSAARDGVNAADTQLGAPLAGGGGGAPCVARGAPRGGRRGHSSSGVGRRDGAGDGQAHGARGGELMGRAGLEAARGRGPAARPPPRQLLRSSTPACRGRTWRSSRGTRTPPRSASTTTTGHRRGAAPGGARALLRERKDERANERTNASRYWVRG